MVTSAPQRGWDHGDLDWHRRRITSHLARSAFPINEEMDPQGGTTIDHPGDHGPISPRSLRRPEKSEIKDTSL